jgi:hypothetical protein
MFASKAGAYLSEPLPHKHKTRLKRLAMDKPSRLLGAFVNYNRKKFYNVGPSCRNDTTLKVYYVISFFPFDSAK